MHCTSVDIALSVGANATDWMNLNASSVHYEGLERSASSTSVDGIQDVAMVKFIAYSIVFPVIIVLGVIGNIINLFVLTRPSLKGVTFVYLSWLAISDLAVLLMGSISMMRLAGIHPRDYSSAFFFAHLEMPLVNAFMASSVFLVVAVTIDRYWSVCLPTRYADIHNERQARVAITMSFVFAFVLYIPVAFQKYPVPVSTAAPGLGDALNMTVEFHACEWSEVSTHPAFKLYLLIKEVAVRVGPAIVVVILNTCIIVTFRRLQKKRASLLGSSAEGKRLAEEQRLVILLVAIVIMFLICMTPAAILTVIISDHYENHLPFQIFRAIANNMEMLNFASNFYVYCLCSSEIRRTFFQLFGGFFSRGGERSLPDASLITSKITKISLDATRV